MEKKKMKGMKNQFCRYFLPENNATLLNLINHK